MLLLILQWQSPAKPPTPLRETSQRLPSKCGSNLQNAAATNISSVTATTIATAAATHVCSPSSPSALEENERTLP